MLKVQVALSASPSPVLLLPPPHLPSTSAVDPPWCLLRPSNHLLSCCLPLASPPPLLPGCSFKKHKSNYIICQFKIFLVFPLEWRVSSLCGPWGSLGFSHVESATCLHLCPSHFHGFTPAITSTPWLGCHLHVCQASTQSLSPVPCETSVPFS